MIPVYFPFTYVPEPMAEAFARLFSTTIVFQAWKGGITPFMRDFAEKKSLDLKVPFDSDEDKLASLLSAYREWARVHQGSELAFFRTQKESVPFFDEMSSHGIRAQIKKTVSGEKKKDKEEIDPVLLARLFLCMAHEYDMNHWQVDMELDKIKKMEEKFLENLTGGEETGKEGFNIRASLALKDDPGAHMTEERLDAWARLAAPHAKDARLFVTHSKAVTDVILERCVKWEPVEDDDPERPAYLPFKNKNGKNNASISLAFYKIELPGDSFFDLCLKQRENQAGSAKNHVIAGLISQIG